jgi:hypothetical protein
MEPVRMGEKLVLTGLAGIVLLALIVRDVVTEIRLQD